MKKFTLAAVIALAATTFVGCGNFSTKADLKSDVDTLSYAIGLAQSNGLRDYLVGRMGMDTTYIDQFIKGLNDGVNAGDDKKKGAYYAGLQIGQQVSNQMIPGINRELFGEDSTKTVSLKNFMAGFITGATNAEGIMSQDVAMITVQQKMEVVKKQQAEEKYGHNKVAGEKFLAENAKKEGVVVLPSGVQYKVIKEGKGEIPTDSSMVKLNYEGRLVNDTIFDSSYKRGVPAQMRPNQGIKGWTEALTKMPVGSTWEIYIPQELAYAERQAGKVEPFSTLIFKVEVLEIIK